MRKLRLGTFVILLLMLTAIVVAATEHEIKVNKISDKIIQIKIGTVTCSPIAIKTEKGVVVVDTGTTFSLAKKVKQIVLKEFGVEKIDYLINTHHHFDHTIGNPIFSDSKIIAHENMAVEMRKGLKGLPTTKEGWQGWVDYYVRMESRTSKDSLKYGYYLDGVTTFKILQEELSKEYQIKDPTITFKDSYKLDLGDLTLELSYFPTAHTNNDILIYIPEEKTLHVGDLIVHYWEPFMADENYDQWPVEEWIKTLDKFINEKKVEKVITSHGAILTLDDLKLRRNYLADLWKDINDLYNKGYKYSDLTRKLNYIENYNYLVDTGIHGFDLRKFHNKMIRNFWKKLQIDGITMVKEIVKNEDIEAVKTELVKLEKQISNNKYFIDETSLNLFAYGLLKEKKYDAAIEAFQLMTRLFPRSFNAYDSLGEAYLVAGKTNKAIASMKKSWEMNPSNFNATKILDEHVPGWLEKYEAVVLRLNNEFYMVNIPFSLRTNMLVLVKPNGSLLIDTGLAGTEQILEKALKNLGVSKANYIINTHNHGDHRGANKIGKNAAVIAYGNLSAFVKSGAVKKGNGVYKTEKGELAPIYYLMNFNGEEIVMIPSQGMHSDADLLIYFPTRKIIIMGDLLLSESFPAVGKNAGKYINWLDNIVEKTPDDLKYIGGHGKMLNKEDLKAYLIGLKESYKLIVAEKKKGKDYIQLRKEDILKKWKKENNFLYWLDRDYWLRGVMNDLETKDKAGDKTL
jgi:glyoxylase-like metal-dependent hydrolase (beta-lactamase superfamily II)